MEPTQTGAREVEPTADSAGSAGRPGLGPANKAEEEEKGSLPRGISSQGEGLLRGSSGRSAATTSDRGRSSGQSAGTTTSGTCSSAIRSSHAGGGRRGSSAPGGVGGRAPDHGRSNCRTDSVDYPFGGSSDREERGGVLDDGPCRPHHRFSRGWRED